VSILAPIACCSKSISERPSGAPSYFLLLVQEKVAKEKDTPRPRLPGILPSRCASGFRGSLKARPCTCSELARILRATLRAHPPARRRGRGAPLAAFLAATARFDNGLASADSIALGREAAVKSLRKHLPAWVPYLAPSSAGSRREKARMFEAMDGVLGRCAAAFAALGRAGRRIPSNAGDRLREAQPARDPGALSFGYFSLDKQRKAARGAEGAPKRS